jgi:hypothetical protein
MKAPTPPFSVVEANAALLTLLLLIAREHNLLRRAKDGHSHCYLAASRSVKRANGCRAVLSSTFEQVQLKAQ